MVIIVFSILALIWLSVIDTFVRLFVSVVGLLITGFVFDVWPGIILFFLFGYMFISAVSQKGNG